MKQRIARWLNSWKLGRMQRRFYDEARGEDTERFIRKIWIKTDVGIYGRSQ